MAIPADQLPHLPLTAADYIGDFAKVRDFFNGDFRDPAAFEIQTERARARMLPRTELAAVLEEQNLGYGCGSRTLDRIRSLTRDRACAIVTGQQVGLFSGPLYTVYKALTAIKLADELNRRGSGCFVPVFWLASDDHDREEIDHITLLDQMNRQEEIRCPTESPGFKIPASHLPLPGEMGDCIRRLRDLTPDSEFKEEILGHLREAYAPGRSFADAFGRWMARLFRSSGLILIDPGHPRLKELGKDVFIREIAESSPSTREALATSRRLYQAGYETQIPLHEGILNLFRLDRERLPLHGSEGEVLTLARQNPSLFSPNVLLRPIYQDALLPTVAYVAGPGEIAYFAQMKGVYESFGLPMPVIYPRKSATIVEKKIDRVLRKYELSLTDLWRRGPGIIGDITKKEIPGSLDESMRHGRDQLDRDFESLKQKALAFEPALKDSLDQAKGKMSLQWTFLEKKIRQAARKRNETAIQQLNKAIEHLFPNQRLQERVFNIVPYLFKYGYGLMERLDQDLPIEEHGHQLIYL